MTIRKFDVGRQNQSLLNEEHYNIFKILEPYLKGGPNSSSSGPESIEGTIDEIQDGALWIDRGDQDFTNSDLKFFSGGQWNLFFKNRFKITGDIISEDVPSDPIDGQLWIDTTGTLNYYYKGVFKPIKAIPDTEHENANLQGFEDFLIIDALTASEKTIIDNFTSWLLDEVPLQKWQSGKNYTLNQGCVHDLDIYICKEDHTSDASNEPGSGQKGEQYAWIKVQKLFQYLVPSTYEDKFYLDGYYVHEKCPIQEEDLVPTAIAGEFSAGEKTAQHLARVKNDHEHDDSCTGYTANTNISISFPVEMVEGKNASAVHVNPKRLHNVTKKFFMIDKNNPIIEMQEENTEYYGFQGGIGKLLVKTDNPNTTEYRSITSSNIDCIRLSAKAAERYDFVYAIHYEFITDSKIKQLGTVTKKRQKLNEDNYIWIGPCNEQKICVFAQGLLYAEDKGDSPTWTYNPETEYLYLAEKLQDVDNMVKTFDFSVVEFEEKVEGRVTDSFETVNGIQCYRLVLPSGMTNDGEFTVFISGLNVDIVGGEVIKHPTSNNILYIPSFTKQMYDAIKEEQATNKNTLNVFYTVVRTDVEIDNVKRNMHRGKARAIHNSHYGVHLPIYSDPKYPVDGALLLRDDESPLLWVDGILTFQKEIERGNDYISIYGLQEGQEVLMMADYKDPSINDEEALSAHLIFEDTVSYATIPTPHSDATIVYVANSVLSDASAVYTSRKPIDAGYHGEIRYHITYDSDNWYRYDAIKLKWIVIDPKEMHTDALTGIKTPLIEVLDVNARGYTHSKKSISFLQNIGEEVCTYHAYKYSDSIEKPLLMGYCIPNDKDGVNIAATEDPVNQQPFKLNSRHVYIPGRNEITVYLNGIRQTLHSPNDFKDFPTSKNREGKLGRYDEFVLAFDDGTNLGHPIPAEEGYHVYALRKWNEMKTVIPDRELSQSEIDNYKAEGWEVEYLSSPNRNIVFYVLEPCETGESKACERKILTFKDALASKGAFVNGCYDTEDFLLTRGNIRVFINGIRQPFGSYQTLESAKNDADPYLKAYNILDRRTIEIVDPIIGNLGGNEGTNNNPLFPIGEIKQPDGTYKKAYHEVIDEIVIETRRDLKLREITVPIKDGSGEFTEQDGLPPELFKTKDRIMIYINGMAYGKDYKIEDNNTIKLLNSEIRQMLGNSNNDVITFEWR